MLARRLKYLIGALTEIPSDKVTSKFTRKWHKLRSHTLVASKKRSCILSLIGSYPDIWAKFCLQYEQSYHLKIGHKNLLLSVHVTQASHDLTSPFLKKYLRNTAIDKVPHCYQLSLLKAAPASVIREHTDCFVGGS
ncbi:hypothetical protein Mapa_001808 [Marchantia paleacea]|nr:hypothetical protein Mapa_001808 [Marchantia paleacea]